jgi:AraC family transcriptional regulator of adaptative response/methylated-DNA-[protein]-cysteine methyltransferase
MEPQADYAHVKQTLAFISQNWREQPSLEVIAAQSGLSPFYLQKLFTRWAGLSPKQFLQAVTLDHARSLLRGDANLLDASHELGLSGPSRLHDLFVTHEGMTPGVYKARGAGLTITYGYHPSPFGTALIMRTQGRLAGLAFADDGGESQALADMTRRWPQADYVEDQAATAALARRVFSRQEWSKVQPLKIIFIGTDFEIRVWQTLLSIPLGSASTYSQVAAQLGMPKASRAVGSAVGRNPLAFVVPCHRVLAKSGALHGYHWGLTRKRAMLGWEAGAVHSSL